MNIKPTFFVKEHLGKTRVSRLAFDDLSIVSEELVEVSAIEREKIFEWFVDLQKNEIGGWRNRACTRKIARLLLSSLRGGKVKFYALFCPSYKKGDGVYGVRTDGVGQTTISGLNNLKTWHERSEAMGFRLEKPLAIFFDIALEHAKKIIENNGLVDFEKNIENFRSVVPKEIDFVRLSEILPEVMKAIGYEGRIIDPLPVPMETYERIVERGGKFYSLFGWSDEEIEERSKLIASSESYVGRRLREVLPGGIMVYTPTMLERAAVYSGFDYIIDPLPIIFPIKPE